MLVDQRLRAGRAWPILINYAKGRKIITYKELSKLIGIHHRPLRYVLSEIQDYCINRKIPPLTVLVINKSSRRPGMGFIAGDKKNMSEDLKKVYDYNWQFGNPFSNKEEVLANSNNQINYWWLNTDPKHPNFRLANLSIGATELFTAYTKGKKPKLRNHFQTVKKGDLFIGYVTSPEQRVVALCRATKGLHDSKEGKAIEVEKVENFGIETSWKELKGMTKLKDCKPLKNNRPTLSELSFAEFNIIYKAATGKRFGFSETTTFQEDALDDMNYQPPGVDNPVKKNQNTPVYKRDHQVRNYVLKRADGSCEYCGEEGFLKIGGGKYLETHHIIALALDGKDTVENVIALCSNHHKEAHYGSQRDQLENQMVKIVCELNKKNDSSE